MDDDILLIEPKLLLSSGWSRHSLRLGAEAGIGRYNDHGSEDYDDSRLYMDGRIDLPSGNLTGGLSRADEHEKRTSPDDLGGLEPTTYTLTAAELAWTFQPGALLVRPDVRYLSFSFDDTPVASTTSPGPPQCQPSATPGVDTCSNTDRDRDVLDAGLRIGYEMSAEYVLFLEGRLTSVDYDDKVDFAGFERSSDGYELRGGSTFDLGSTLFGEVYAGLRHWTFDDPSFETIDGPAFGADVTWTLTPLTTLKLSADSTIEATTIVGAAGIQRTAFGLSADHELLRNLLLWARASTATENFEGIDRDDDLRELGLGARYLMNRRIYLMLDLENENRDSSGSDSSGQKYNINRIGIRLQVNL